MSSFVKLPVVVFVSSNSVISHAVISLFESERAGFCRADDSHPRQVLRAIEREQPDIVIVDPDTVGLRPAAFMVELRKCNMRTEVIGYVACYAGGLARECLKAGFAGIVSQSGAMIDIVEAVRTVAMGGVFIGEGFEKLCQATGEEPLQQDPTDLLSPRERHVLEQVARGLSLKEIANELGISTKTVETYKARASEKIGLTKRSSIVEFALERSWP